MRYRKLDIGYKREGYCSGKAIDEEKENEGFNNDFGKVVAEITLIDLRRNYMGQENKK